MKSYLAALAVLLLFSCGSETTDTHENLPINDTINLDSIADISPTFNPLPSPLQITFLFKKAGLKFVDGAGNDVSLKSNYSTSIAKQLNLGVYSADFAYCALNRQRIPGTAYLQVIEELADDLGLAGAYNTIDNRERFERNADNIDSVALIISELQMDADQYFVDNNEQDKAIIIFTGAWIESMYLGAKTRDLSDNVGIAGTLLEQADIVKELLIALGTIDTDETLLIMIGNLESIDGMFDDMLADQHDADELVVSADKLYQLINLIFTTRNSIVIN